MSIAFLLVALVLLAGSANGENHTSNQTPDQLSFGRTENVAKVLKLVQSRDYRSGKVSLPAPRALLNKDALETAVSAWVANPTSAAVTYGDIKGWDVSKMTDMSYLFCGCSDCYTAECSAAKKQFNGDLSGWDVSKVTSMR